MKFYIFAVFAVVLMSCGATTDTEKTVVKSDPSDLYNTTWQWFATTTPAEQITASDPERYSVWFSDDGKIRAQFDCNSGRGDFTVSDNKIKFGPLIATRMACPEDTQDFVFMRDLQRVSSYFIENGELFLELPYDSGSMRFREAQK